MNNVSIGKGGENAIDRNHSTAMKGFLIIFVVFGHNLFVGEFNHGFYDWVYSFHVSSFFLLPFFYPDHRLSLDRIKIYAKRLLWPYSYLFVFFYIIYGIVSKSWNYDIGCFRTFIAGDFYKISYYTKFQYIWFLPALFSMLVIKDTATIANKRIGNVLIFVSAMFFVMFGIFLYHRPYPFTVNTTISQYLPLTAGISFAMFFLGFVTKTVLTKCSVSSIAYGIIMIVSLFVLCLKVNTPSYNIYMWVSRLICPIAGFAFLFRTVHAYNCLLFREIGKLSLPIYVIHQPLNVVVCTFFQRLSLPSSLTIIVSFSIVLFVAYFLAKFLYSHNWLKLYLFPS